VWADNAEVEMLIKPIDAKGMRMSLQAARKSGEFDKQHREGKRGTTAPTSWSIIASGRFRRVSSRF
jgi:hypothetical protein